jgi:membrane protease subunit (stomatin/prohibitin family)
MIEPSLYENLNKMEVIEFLDNSGNVLVKRMPDNGTLEIKWGSQLTVRESQDAVFFRDGKALDVFGPGRHILKTQNIPVVGKWVTSFGYGENSPFRAEVVFVGKQLFPNLKWGTREPILFRDSEFNIIRLRAFGNYSIQVSDTMLFVNKVVGTRGLFSTDSIEDYLKGIIVSKLNVVLGANLKTVLDIAGTIDQLNLILRTELQNDFSGLGLVVHDLYIQSISVPDEVQKIIDTKSGMGVLGNLDQYMKFKVANAIGDAANNTGSAGDGMGTGAGLAMGMNMAQMINQSINPHTAKEDPIEKIKKLKELVDIGALTRDEFDKKKNEILKNI